QNLVEMFEPVGTPAKRGAERGNEAVSDGRHGGGLEAFEPRVAPVPCAGYDSVSIHGSSRSHEDPRRLHRLCYRTARLFVFLRLFVGSGHMRCSLPLTYVMRSTNWVSAPALACAPLSMIEQNGHAVTTVFAPVARSCANRTSLIRQPGSSSLVANNRPPPAPQQYGLSRLRSGSWMSAPK